MTSDPTVEDLRNLAAGLEPALRWAHNGEIVTWAADEIDELRATLAEEQDDLRAMNAIAEAHASRIGSDAEALALLSHELKEETAVVVEQRAKIVELRAALVDAHSEIMGAIEVDIGVEVVCSCDICKASRLTDDQ